MAHVVIRRCSPLDEKGIVDVCYRTGYMGEDLTGTNRFNDIKLFGYLFCSYYPLYEPQHCFAAVDLDRNNKIVGYIIGTDNSKRQQLLFIQKMLVKIVLRLMLYSIVKYHESFRAVMYLISKGNLEKGYEKLYEDYPAHLHINILPEYQHMGIGSRLLDAFEENMKENNVRGIHLRTSNKNYKAIPFYKRKGYEIIYEGENIFWKGIDDYRSLIFVKKI